MQIFGKDYSFKVLCITIFPEKTQNKKQSRDKNDFLLMMENTWSKKPYTSSLLSRAGRKDSFKKQQTTNKHIIWKDE